VSILDKICFMGWDLLSPGLESYLDKLFDKNTSQTIDEIPPEILILCLAGLFVYSLAFGYKVGRNYKR
jgi:hypothetical protein